MKVFAMKNEMIFIEQFQIVTSGYETSMESDTHFCNKNLISILKFSANQQLDVRRRIDAISSQLEKPKISVGDKMISIISDQLSISNTHIKLLDQILNNSMHYCFLIEICLFFDIRFIDHVPLYEHDLPIFWYLTQMTQVGFSNI